MKRNINLPKYFPDEVLRRNVLQAKHLKEKKVSKRKKNKKTKIKRKKITYFNCKLLGENV
jgi:hypothetical protein